MVMAKRSNDCIILSEREKNDSKMSFHNILYFIWRSEYRLEASRMLKNHECVTLLFRSVEWLQLRIYKQSNKN